MPLMSAGEARVIDPVLSTVARGYKNAEMVGMGLFPYVPVGQRGGKVLSFGKEAFMAYNSARAPGGAVTRLSMGYAGESYALTDHALAAQVPVELLEEARAVPGIDLASASIRTVQDALALRLEMEQATLATTAANYATGSKVTLATTAQWSAGDSSNPLGDVETARDAVRAKVGRRANTVVMGPAVFSALRNHPKVLERIKYTGRDVPTVELLASLFGVAKVYVGDAVTASAGGVFSDIWGKSVVVAYTEAGGVAELGRPTFGYTYRLNGYPSVGAARYDGDTRSWLYDVFDAVSPVIAGQTAGYLISAVVA